jgi:hypothetical protein
MKLPEVFDAHPAYVLSGVAHKQSQAGFQQVTEDGLLHAVESEAVGVRPAVTYRAWLDGGATFSCPGGE